MRTPPPTSVISQQPRYCPADRLEPPYDRPSEYLRRLRAHAAGGHAGCLPCEEPARHAAAAPGFLPLGLAPPAVQPRPVRHGARRSVQPLRETRFVNKWIPAAGSVLLTLLAVAIAVVVSLHLAHYYMESPWTRDGHVHADIIQVAPDVSGLVTELKVRDNQKVRSEERRVGKECT